MAVRNKDDEIGKLRAEVGHLKIKQVEAAQKLQQNVEELQVAVRNKDNEIGRLQAEAGILKIKEVEAVQKLQQNVDVLQVEIRNKDDENCRLRAEAANGEKMVPTLEGKLLEMHSLVKEKNDEIQKLINGLPESLKCKCASSIPVVKLEEVGSCIDLDENTTDHEHASGEIISELRKLKRGNKDKEATEAAQKLQQNIRGAASGSPRER